MSVTATIVRSCKIDSESYQTGTETVTGDVAQIISDTIANAAGVTTAVLPFEFAKLKALFLLADEDLDVTFLDGASNVSFNLTADTPTVWTDADGLACPFGADVTGANATNASGNNCTFTARILTTA